MVNPMTYCSNCGEKLPKDALFCPKCGTKAATVAGASAGTPSDEMREAFTRMSHEMEKAFSIAAKEVQEAFQTARNNIQKTSTKNPLPARTAEKKTWATLFTAQNAANNCQLHKRRKSPKKTPKRLKTDSCSQIPVHSAFQSINKGGGCLR